MEHVFFDPGMRASYRVYGGRPLRQVGEAGDAVGIDVEAARREVRRQAGVLVAHYMTHDRLSWREAMAKLKEEHRDDYDAYGAS